MKIDYSSPIELKLDRRFEIRSKLKSKANRRFMLEACKKDVVLWANAFCFTYDPRVTPSLLPFYLFPLQEQYLRWRTDRRASKNNGLIEKSRDMGLSYLNCLSQLHCWLFEYGYKGSFGSRKEMLVDRIGDPDSLFEKIRIILRNLPSWMYPKKFDFDKHDNFCKLINPETGATLTGEAGKNIGRGGRSAVYDVDEAAFLEYPKKVDAALSNNTDVIFYTSTVNGIGNLFYQKRMNYPENWIFTFHWKNDPRKNQQWYEGMKLKFDEVTIAQEIDIDYSASIEGIFIPAIWVQAAVLFDIPSTGVRRAGLDVAASGKNKNVFTPRKGNVIGYQEVSGESNTTLTAYWARDQMYHHELKHLSYDGDGIGAGVASTYALLKDLKFTHTAVRSGGSASDRTWEGEERTSKDKFANKRAELWGIVRERFRKTYNQKHGFAQYPIDELISIPDDPELILQLSTPLSKMTATGKILVESKEDMAKRGIPSPDKADSLIYSEEYEVNWF